MKCYSIGNKDKNYDESDLINLTKKRFDLNHKFIIPNEEFSYHNILI